MNLHHARLVFFTLIAAFFSVPARAQVQSLGQAVGKAPAAFNEGLTKLGFMRSLSDFQVTVDRERSQLPAGTCADYRARFVLGTGALPARFDSLTALPSYRGPAFAPDTSSLKPLAPLELQRREQAFINPQPGDSVWTHAFPICRPPVTPAPQFFPNPPLSSSSWLMPSTPPRYGLGLDLSPLVDLQRRQDELLLKYPFLKK